MNERRNKMARRKKLAWKNKVTRSYLIIIRHSFHIFSSPCLFAPHLLLYFIGVFFLFLTEVTKKNINNKEHTHSEIKKKIMCIFKQSNWIMSLDLEPRYITSVPSVNSIIVYHQIIIIQHVYFKFEGFFIHLFLVWSRMTEIHMLMKKV